jgi:hypothetical protein
MKKEKKIRKTSLGPIYPTLAQHHTNPRAAHSRFLSRRGRPHLFLWPRSDSPALPDTAFPCSLTGCAGGTASQLLSAPRQVKDGWALVLASSPLEQTSASLAGPLEVATESLSTAGNRGSRPRARPGSPRPYKLTAAPSSHLSVPKPSASRVLRDEERENRRRSCRSRPAPCLGVQLAIREHHRVEGGRVGRRHGFMVRGRLIHQHRRSTAVMPRTRDQQRRTVSSVALSPGKVHLA